MRQVTKTDKFHGSKTGSDTAVFFDRLAGISFRSDTEFPYDTYGRTARHFGPVTVRFADRIENWLDTLEMLCGRPPQAVVVCSVFRPHRGGDTKAVSRHAQGRAIDIGGVWWSSVDGVTAWTYARRRRRAVAVEATLRLMFGTVLGPTANRRHADHWHVDDGKPVGISEAELRQSRRGTRKIEIAYIQDACSSVHGRPLTIDGLYGPKTHEAVSAVLDEMKALGPKGINSIAAYVAFLTATATKGFAGLDDTQRDLPAIG